jgi:hypothetical protein
MAIPRVSKTVYLTCMGAQGIAGKNKGGSGSRGYMVSIKGRTVTRQWGAVIPVRRKYVRIQWLRTPRELRNTFPAISDAKAFFNEILREKLEPGQGYAVLRSRTRIYPAPVRGK